MRGWIVFLGLPGKITRRAKGCALAGALFALSSATVALAQSPIRVGISMSMTGAYAAIGENVLRGVKLCVKRANNQKEFPGAEMSYQTAEGYGACQILTEAVRRAGSLDADKVRAVILGLNTNTAFGAFRVDPDGVQVAHRMLMFQWQDGKKVIVWPEELAADRPRFPTPVWNQRP